MRTRMLVPLLCLGLGLAQAQETQPLDGAQLRALDTTLTWLAEHGTARTVGVLGAFGMGSGAVVTADGHVLTNAHVASGAPHAVVVWADGRKKLARLRGISFVKDLALLELVDPYAAPLPCFTLAAEDAGPALGDFVAALGHPGGIRADLRPAFSFGRVNKLGEGITVSGFLDYTDGIETDIPLFNGNSGGPLVNRAGELVGINGAVAFATPSAYAVSLENLHAYLPAMDDGLLELSGALRLRMDNRLAQRIFKLIDRLTLESLQEAVDGDRFGLSDGEWERRRTAAAEARARLGLDGSGRQRAVPGRPSDAPRDLSLEPAFADAFELPLARVVALFRNGEPMGYATALSGRHLVTKGSGLAEGQLEVEIGGQRHPVELVASDADVDLGLLALTEAALPEGAWTLADSPRPGQLVLALASAGPAACGALSTEARRVAPPSALGALPQDLQSRLMRTIARLARLLDSELLQDIVDSYERAQEMQQRYSGGNTPRAYDGVFQHDAPIGSDEVGTPLLDVEGRLVGINIARAFQGTNYAVPAERAFALLRSLGE